MPLPVKPIPLLLRHELPRRFSDDLDVNGSKGEVRNVGHGDAAVEGDVPVVAEEVRDYGREDETRLARTNDGRGENQRSSLRAISMTLGKSKRLLDYQYEDYESVRPSWKDIQRWGTHQARLAGRESKRLRSKSLKEVMMEQRKPVES